MSRKAKQQFLALQQQSQQTQTALDVAHDTLRELEDELADFLDDYYARVGRDFEILTELREALRAEQVQCFHREKPAQIAQDTPRRQPDTVRRLYRDMARDCHPDRLAGEAENNAAGMKAELMKTLNAAYARKNLSEMWKIKWELERHKNNGSLSHKQRLELLKAQQEQMRGALEELRRREEEVRASAAYRLMQHARMMQLCGQDFIALVRARVERQIAEAQEQLLSARIQRRYWGHVRMKPETRAGT